MVTENILLIDILESCVGVRLWLYFGRGAVFSQRRRADKLDALDLWDMRRVLCGLNQGEETELRWVCIANKIGNGRCEDSVREYGRRMGPVDDSGGGGLDVARVSSETVNLVRKGRHQGAK